jgi:hypothetical protein
MSDSDLDSLATAHDVDELYDKITTLEDEKNRLDKEIECLHERADICITESAQCFRDNEQLHRELTTTRLDIIDQFEGQLIRNRFTSRCVTGLFIMASLHFVCGLSIITKKFLVSNALIRS